ncbi:hypothetical protein ACIQMY_06350 [Streptomyces sp. NPDC091368]|uniref:hypothetical protein n=1 Tax=Streptomyces sp. NPDC091368 TaxID=3365993 RepID=UPI0038280EFB
MGRNEGRETDRPDPGPDRPLRLVPGVGEHRDAAGVLRSCVDPGATLFRAATPRGAVDTFVREHAKDLGTDRADLREVDAAEGAATLHVHYQQFHQDLPVLGAGVRMAADTGRAAVVQVVNTLEPDVSEAPDPREDRGPDVVRKAALRPFRTGYDSAAIVRDALVHLRDTSRPALPDVEPPTATFALLKEGRRRPDGRLHLVHDLVVETTGPFEHFRVVVDAVAGELLWTEIAGKYVTATLKVFRPDPVTEKDEDFDSTTGQADLVTCLHDVQADVAPAGPDGRFHLDGDWCRCLDWDAPAFPQPAPSSAAFVFTNYPDDRTFLSANAYFWIDSFARHLRDLGHTALNSRMTKVDVDPQGAADTGRSEWIGTTTPPRIRFDTDHVPGAADLGVIVHEYTHGVVQWLRPGLTGGFEYEHGVCDAMAGLYRDRFNPSGHRRAETFPFDHNAKDVPGSVRRLDLSQRFDDAGFDDYAADLRTSMLATALWQCYLGIGGSKPDAASRGEAADQMIRTLLEALPLVPPDTEDSGSNAVQLARSCIAADAALTGGVYGKVMDEAFVRQGLWTRRPVDLFIADSAQDNGILPSTDPFWVSPDIWVRNKDLTTGDDPEAGHQEPIAKRLNYLYVRVHNRGTETAAPDRFKVETWRCDPGTGMIWPDHFKSISKETIHEAIPPGGSVRVGPFPWTPTVADHECLIAIVSGADDPAVTDTLASLRKSVPHHLVVKYDNNVGQRNVYPRKSVLGGQNKMVIRLRGGPRTTVGQWRLDATAMPDDTRISVKTLSSLVNASSLTGITVTGTGDVRSTLGMAGGTTAVVDGFTLGAGAEVVAEILIDFSHQAENLKDYDFVATQIQDGEVAGRITIEITAVTEFEGVFFGNPHTREMHISTCPFWGQLGPASKVPFFTRDDALARGYDGCAFCLPDADTG